MSTITVHDALTQMRNLTKIGSPFTFTFVSFNTSTNSSKGIVTVSNALLRVGLSREQSDKSEVLIGYTVEPEAKPRWFYLPLLLKFNGIKVIP